VYRERASRVVAGAAVWTREVPAGPAAADRDPLPRRILPDGCVDLIWCDGDLLVAGPDTRAVLVSSPPGARYVAIRLPPGVGPAVLGVPADELRDRRIPLDALWPAAAAHDIADRVEADRLRGAALEEVALARLADHPPDAAARFVAARLGEGLSVAAVAGAVGFSERQLRRRCVSAFGYGPKTLARILRLQRALLLARETTPTGAGLRSGAAVAAAAGYADQAHLAREAKALTGVPLSQL
jgi:AraC-like DNA-binding protein